MDLHVRVDTLGVQMLFSHTTLGFWRKQNRQRHSSQDWLFFFLESRVREVKCVVETSATLAS